MSKERGKIIIVTAPSGAGKSTLIGKVIGVFPDLNFSVSATTRKPRANEVHGKHYYFITREEFERRIAANEFVEWERVYDYYYGTLKPETERVLNAGKHLLFEVEVKGAESIKEQYPGAAMIFISPPDLKSLAERLAKRKTESAEDFQKRMDRAKMELAYKDRFEYVIINDDVETASRKLKDIISKILITE